MTVDKRRNAISGLFTEKAFFSAGFTGESPADTDENPSRPRWRGGQSRNACFMIHDNLTHYASRPLRTRPTWGLPTFGNQRSFYFVESKLFMEDAVSFVESDAEIRHFSLHFVIGFIDLAYLGVLILFIRVIQRVP